MSVKHARSDEDFLTVPEAADYRGVSVHTIRRWVREGRLKAYRTHTGLRRIKLGDLRVTERMVPDAPGPDAAEPTPNTPAEKAS